MKNSSRHCLILAVASITIWMTGAFGEFVWIDHAEIQQAGYRITSWDDFRLVWTSSLDSYAERESGTLNADGGYFRPVYAMLITVDWILWGGQPFVFHLTNIAVHTLVVIALYWLGRQLLPETDQSNIVFAATLLFAVHPLGVHSVTWISGRKDSLCALFAILALLGFGSLLKHSPGDRSWFKRLAIVLLSVVSLNLGLLCKELAIVTPAFAMLWYWTSSTRSNHVNQPDPRPFNARSPAIVLLVLFWLTSIFALVFRKWVLGGIGLNIGYPAESWIANLSTSCNLVCWYVVRVLFPFDPTIVDRWPISTGLTPLTLLPVLMITVGAAYIFMAVVQRRMPGLLFSWFLIWILPATGLVPLRHLYAERYLYPASWGLVLAIVLVSRPWFNRFSKPPLAFGIAIGLIATWFSLQTIVANQYWSSDESLFGHALHQDERYAEGLAAMSLVELERQNFQRALELGESAIQSGSDEHFRSYWSPFGVYSNSGLAAYYQQDMRRAQDLFKTAQTYRPNNANSSYHLGLVAEASNRPADSIKHYENAISINPDHHASRVNLGHLFLFQQRFGDCISILQPTVDADPNNHLAQLNIATAYLLSGDFSSAEVHFESAIQLVPQDPVNLAKLAWSEFAQGKESEGKNHLDQAKLLLPDNPTIRFVEQKYLRN